MLLLLCHMFRLQFLNILLVLSLLVVRVKKFSYNDCGINFWNEAACECTMLKI